MGIVGLVGGLGPESTIDYYRRLLDGWAKIDPSTSPSIVIDSLDVQLALRLVATDKPALIGYLGESIRRLAGAGVDFIAMTANTPHIVFDELAAGTRTPLVSIVETCADEAQRRGLKRLALLGTRFTMEAPFYPEVFARRGLAVVTPSADERVLVHERYVGQLLKGDFRDETRSEIVAVIERLARDEGVEAVILGGTELPLLLRSDVVACLPTLDTTALHVEAILSRLRELDLEIAPAPLTSDVAHQLIAALNAELAAAYPEPGANHFRLDPSEVGPGAGAFVVATWRGTGVGRRLLERLEREARTLGLTRLVLETGTRQLAALRMYRAAGFTDIPPYGEYVASPSTSVCLSKAV